MPKSSTDLTTVDTAGYPAFNHSAEEIREIIADNLGGQDVGQFDLTRFKVPTGGATSWEVETLEGVQTIRELQGIIVHTAQTRSWWPVTLDESREANTPPSCSSPDARTGYGKQWATKDDPNPEGEPRSVVCAECPHSQWGSGKNGGQSCGLKGHWFLLLEGSFLPVVMTLPPMSLKPTRKYMLGLAGAGIRFSDVVTKIHLERAQSGSNVYARVIPELAGRLAPQDALKAREYGALLKPLFERLPQEDIPVADGNGHTDPAGGAPPMAKDGLWIPDDEPAAMTLDDERPLTKEEAGF